MKKKLSVFILLLLLFIVPSIRVKADMFAKPTSEVDVVGIETDYYFEILVKKEEAKLLDEDDLLDQVERNYYSETYPADIFNGYQDSDGYVSRTLYTGIPAVLQKLEDHKYKVGYFSAPQKFKIAIVVDDNILLVSKKIDRKMFDSKITFDLSEVDITYSQSNIGKVKENIPYGSMSWKFIVRVLVTIAVELLILLLFNYKKLKSFIIVGATNLFTQTVLTIFMFLSFYFWGEALGLILAIIIGEIAVFTVEMITYKFTLKEQSNKRALLYGFVANLATLVLSFLSLSFI